MKGLKPQYFRSSPAPSPAGRSRWRSAAGAPPHSTTTTVVQQARGIGEPTSLSHRKGFIGQPDLPAQTARAWWTSR